MIQLIIVEDHVSLIDGLKLLFEKDTDIEVIDTALDGIELMSILEYRNPNVILTDISMPRMNGIELCKRVKEKNPKIKVVAFTMFDDASAVKEMMNAGVDGYVLKIRSLSTVREAILSVSRGNAYIDPSITVNPNSEIPNGDTDILSRSEREILKLMAAGNRSSDIAEIRHTAVSTIHKHRKNMIQKLGLEGKGELLRFALQQHPHYK
ncbi:response regulator [Nonlabens antarcticus]|uniref:response regulator n=1 Tax=Nonlabens antarcticus TaxID=392714 RepID=UPI001891B926|nr:response regulator transcription factor [Nonlabens antarcticus]